MPAEIYLNVAVSGLLTGLVYGLMALGLSVIFGVVRVVNFAHGEMMAIAMYLAVVLFALYGLGPLAMMVPELCQWSGAMLRMPAFMACQVPVLVNEPLVI